MCSICGIATEEPHRANTSAVVDMLRKTEHRGPDGCGLHAGGEAAYGANPDDLEKAAGATGAARVVVAQSRLRITGSHAGRQPFVSTDGKLALAHNGEFYNYPKVTQALDDSVETRTGSDTEVFMRVLEDHYAATGGQLAAALKRTVHMAAGMYALAATDGDTLVLARDAVGKKPLYYVDGQTFAFASERKALVEIARAEDAPIRRLRPGELLTWEPGAPVTVETVEQLTTPPIDITDYDTAFAEYEKAIHNAIERRTRGLEEAAVYFSGGVDSVMVAKLLQNRGIKVKGYVCGLDGSSDVEAATAVAEELGIPLKIKHIDEDLIEKWLPRILEAAELHGPMMAEVSVPMWFSAMAAHEDGHRIVFSGQAADELMAGYAWYRGVLETGSHLTLHARLWEDVRALPIDCLEREDRISMAWSLEMRAPFLDSDVIRVAMRIAPQLKLRDENDMFGKLLHRDLALKVGVPKSVAYREKIPAQDGSSIHDVLQKLAERRFPGNEIPVTDVPDFGSNYRYRDEPGKYGTPKVRALLQTIVDEHAFVVAGEDASAHAPPLPKEVAVARKN